MAITIITTNISIKTMTETTMKLKLFLLLLATALLTSLSGCTVSGPGIKIRPPIHVEGGGAPGHCPPGQAKKGRC